MKLAQQPWILIGLGLALGAPLGGPRPKASPLDIRQPMAALEANLNVVSANLMTRRPGGANE